MEPLVGCSYSLNDVYTARELLNPTHVSELRMNGIHLDVARNGAEIAVLCEEVLPNYPLFFQRIVVLARGLKSLASIDCHRTREDLAGFEFYRGLYRHEYDFYCPNGWVPGWLFDSAVPIEEAAVLVEGRAFPLRSKPKQLSPEQDAELNRRIERWFLGKATPGHA